MIDPPAFIPPLKLTPKDSSIHYINTYFGPRNASENDKNSLLLKRNPQSLHEKSLYSYYNADNKCAAIEETPIVPPAIPPHSLQLQGSRYQLSRVLSSQLKPQQAAGCLVMKEEANRDKHFKRKNRLNRNQLQRMKLQREQGTMDNEQDQTGNGQTDITLPKSFSMMNLQVNKQDDMTRISRQYQLTSQQNKILKQRLVEKEEIITHLLAKVSALQKERILLEGRLKIIGEQLESSTNEQAQLRDQLADKQVIFRQLQRGYRYVEIENTVLKHTKMQCSTQIGVIEHLEKEKKMLEEKVKILYGLNKKKKKKQGVPLKQDSQISFTLSLSSEKEGKKETSSTQRGEWSERSFLSPELA